MKKVKLYLKTILFVVKNNRLNTNSYVDPIPPTAMILEGEVVDKGHGGFTITVNTFYSEQHKELKGSPCTLFVPNSKIDHIRLLD